MSGNDAPVLVDQNGVHKPKMTMLWQICAICFCVWSPGVIWVRDKQLGIAKKLDEEEEVSMAMIVVVAVGGSLRKCGFIRN